MPEAVGVAHAAIMGAVMVRTLVVVVAVAAAAAVGLSSQAPGGGLPYGAAPVGFRVIAARDATRADRGVSIHVWYPAAAAGPAMRLGDSFADQPAGRREQVADLTTLTNRLFGLVPDGSIESMLNAPMRASRDAPPAPERAPLIVAQLRPLSNAYTFEVLASHGYVVAAVDYAAVETGTGAALEREGRSTDGLRRDLEVAIARMRQESFVASGPVGAFGFSGAGVPAIALAAARDDVGALALFETGWHGSLGSSLAAIPGFDLARVRTPLLFAWGAGMDAADAHLRDLRAMPARPKTIAWVRATGLTHWDFAAEGYLGAADPHWRAADRTGIRAIFEETHALLIAFFDRHLRSRVAAPVATPHIKIEVLPNAGDPVGVWAGRAVAGTQTTDIAIEIRALQGGLGFFMTLPPLHAYKMPVGYLTARADGTWSIPDWGIIVRRDGRALTGQLGDPRVTFAVTAPAPDASATATLPAADPPAAAHPAGPEPAWRYDARAPVWAGLTASGAFVYAADASGTVHAIRARDGTPIWTKPGEAPIYGAPAVGGGAVFVLDDGGLLRKLAATTGVEMWRASIGGAMTTRVLPAATVFDFDYRAPSPILRDGVIYVSSSTGVVHAIDAMSGGVRWRLDLKSQVRAPAALSARLVVVGTLDHDVVAIDRMSGVEVWRTRLTGAVTSAATIANDVVVVGSRGAFLTGLDLSTGRERWASSQWFSWVESSGTLVDGLVYVGSSDLRVVRAIEPATGVTRWQTDVLGWAWGTPVVTRDAVYVGVAAPKTYVTRHEAGVVALNRATGRVQWRRPAAFSDGAFLAGYPGSGVISAGVLCLPSVSGSLEGYILK